MLAFTYLQALLILHVLSSSLKVLVKIKNVSVVNSSVMFCRYWEPLLARITETTKKPVEVFLAEILPANSLPWCNVIRKSPSAPTFPSWVSSTVADHVFYVAGKLCSWLHLPPRSESSCWALEVALRKPNTGTESFKLSREGGWGEAPDRHCCWQLQSMLNHACRCRGLQTDWTRPARLKVNHSIYHSNIDMEERRPG